jgi:AAHS family 4-hydroxybenzoate transporter-like MFS transporter
VNDIPPRTLDVAQFMQDLRFSRYHLQILILCSLVTFFDGQDFAALAYALPYIRDDMGISDQMTGYVSSAAFLGQMIGSLFGSYMGDIFGRRPVIIVCTIASAILTFAVGFAASPEQIIGLRFVSGLAIGGLLAPAWALSIESMPQSMRATSVTIVMMGFSFGTASAGPIANWTAPAFGWEGIFWVSGVMTGAFALILLFLLPESARWLVATQKPRERIVPMLARFNTGFDVETYEGFSLPDERAAASSANPVHKFRELFVGALAFVTPLIWIAYFFSSFAIYLKSAYGVIFMENLGIARQNAAWIGSAGAILGALGGVALLAMTERRGPRCGDFHHQRLLPQRRARHGWRLGQVHGQVRRRGRPDLRRAVPGRARSSHGRIHVHRAVPCRDRRIRPHARLFRSRSAGQQHRQLVLPI